MWGDKKEGGDEIVKIWSSHFIKDLSLLLRFNKPKITLDIYQHAVNGKKKFLGKKGSILLQVIISILLQEYLLAFQSPSLVF